MIDAITQLRADEAGLPAAESHPDPPLHSFPLRIDWENSQPAVPESHGWPDPEIVARPLTLDMPRAVAGLIAAVVVQGWGAVCTEARGAYPSVGGRPSRQRWSIAVRMWRGSDHALAVYLEGPGEETAWSWDFLCWWGPSVRMTTVETITEFMDGLMGKVHGPTLKDAHLGPMLGPKRMPPGFLNKIGPIHGPELPPPLS